MNLRLGIYLIAAVMLAVSWASACFLYRAAEVGALIAPLEERNFEQLSLVMVGTGGAYENPQRLGPCIGVGLGTQVILVDAGRGVAEGLRNAGMPVSQPNTILLTNLLPENTVGLDDLVFTGWLEGRDRPLQLIGPPGTSVLAANLLEAHGRGSAARHESLALPQAGAKIEVLEVEGGWVEEREGLRISAGALHGGPTLALAWRFEHRGRSVVISGTGWDPDALADFSTGAHMLVHEAVFVPTPEEAEAAGISVDPDRLLRESAVHTSIADVGQLAARAGVESLVLVRMRPPPMFSIQVSQPVGKSFPGRVLVPEDGDEIQP